MPGKSTEELENVYFLYGNDEYLAEGAIKKLKELFKQEIGDPEFSIENLDLSNEETTVKDVINASDAISFLTARKLVIVKEVTKQIKAETDELVKYISNPNPSTVLVLVAHFPAADERKDPKDIKKIESSKLYKAANKVGKPIKLTIGGWQEKEKLEKWVLQAFENKGKRINRRIVRNLIEVAGERLRELEQVIERICLYAKEDEITEKDVEEVVNTRSADTNAFDFIDAVMAKDQKNALQLYGYLMQQKESPDTLFNLMLRQYRMVMKTKSMMKNHSQPEIVSELKVPPFLAKKCMNQARKFTEPELRKRFLKFQETMLEMRNTPYLKSDDYKEVMVEILISRLTGSEESVETYSRPFPL
jgi:DNA polymerase III subunit delta